MKINDKISFRTAGRGQIKTWKGQVVAIVKEGQLPPKKFWPMLNHANKKSNRDRVVVELTTGDFAWANASGPNTAGPGEKLQEYRRRGQGRLPKKPAKKTRLATPGALLIGHLKKKKTALISKSKPPKAKSAVKQIEESMRQQPEPTVSVPDAKAAERGEKAQQRDDEIAAGVRRKDKPKKTWYGPNGEAVRKVVCPEGFSAVKPEPKTPVAEPEQTTPAEPVTAAQTTLDLEPHDITADAVSLNSAG